MTPFRRNKNRQKPNYAFIDSQNLNLGTQKMGWKMDWRKFRQYLREVYKVDKAFMFIGYLQDNEKLYDQMHELGYLVVLKPTLNMFKPPGEDGSKSRTHLDDMQGAGEERSKSYKKYDARAPQSATPQIAKSAISVSGSAAEQDSVVRATKGNVDAELVLYAVKEMPNYDKAIVVSGDGDFFCLVEYLDQQGKLLKLLTPNWQYSSLLKPFESYIVRLDQKRRELAYRGFHNKPKKRAEG